MIAARATGSRQLLLCSVLGNALHLMSCGTGDPYSLGAHQPRLADDDSSNEGGSPSVDRPVFDCDVSTPPQGSDPSGLYSSFADAAGVFVFARSDVDARAVNVACEGVLFLLAGYDEVRDEMAARGATVVVVASDASITQVPVLSGEEDVLDSYRSYGAAVGRPVTVVGEENVLCLPSDPYEGESLLVHAFAHSVLNLGIPSLDPAFSTRLNGAYDAAISAGKWANTFAASSPAQYFAEGTQSFFSVNLEASPANGVHNEIDTRAELESYDPTLFSLIEEHFRGGGEFPLCP